MGNRSNASARANRAILFLSLVLAFSADAWAQVSIPYTRAALPVQCLPGACYYVDAVNGSDANAGTSLQQAFQTLQQAENVMSPGATVLVANGVYTDSLYNPLNILKPGMPGQWTTFAAIPGQHPIIQLSRGAYAWEGIGIQVSYVLIDGFEIIGQNQSVTPAEAAMNDDTQAFLNASCVSISSPVVPPPHDVIVRNSILHDCTGGAILAFATDSVFFISNWIYNNGWWNVNGDAGINIVHQVDSPGSKDIAGYRSYIVGNLLAYNRNYLIWNGLHQNYICDGNAIIIDGNQHTQPAIGVNDEMGVPYTGRTYIANNVVHDTGAHGLAAFESSHVDIANNTTYNDLLTDSPCLGSGEIYAQTISDVNVVNNVAINSNGKQVTALLDGASFDYNVWDGTETAPIGAHDFHGNSLLIAAAQGIFIPKQGSPALGSGTDKLAPTVDFSGNPRQPGAVDRGAIQVTGIAANYEGLWWAAGGAEAGWGINFAHQGEIIFATWFTYDLSGKGWWLTMTAPQTAPGVYSGALYTTTGPAFNAIPFNPAQVVLTQVGTGRLSFSDANDGTFAYTVNGISQTKNITHQVFGPLPGCATATESLSAATNYQDLWWASPAGSESGWGVNLTHEGETIFATWFTYDLDSTPMWLSVTAPETGPGVYSGTLYRTTGPAFNAVPFNPASVVLTSVGTATLTFSDGNDASFAYTVNGVSQAKAITRQVFQVPGTVCQ
jgi:hypothetical protein